MTSTWRTELTLGRVRRKPLGSRACASSVARNRSTVRRRRRRVGCSSDLMRRPMKGGARPAAAAAATPWAADRASRLRSRQHGCRSRPRSRCGGLPRARGPACHARRPMAAPNPGSGPCSSSAPRAAAPHSLAVSGPNLSAGTYTVWTGCRPARPPWVAPQPQRVVLGQRGIEAVGERRVEHQSKNSLWSTAAARDGGSRSSQRRATGSRCCGGTWRARRSREMPPSG